MNDNIISFNKHKVKRAIDPICKKFHCNSKELADYANALLSKNPVMTQKELEESIELYMIRKIYG